MLQCTARLSVVCDGSSLGHVLDASRLLEEVEATGPLEASSPRGVERSAPSSWAQGNGRGAAEDTQPAPELRPPAALEPAAGALEPSNGTAAVATPLLFDNGIGGLNAAGEYEMCVHADALPPAPWVNVVANPFGGFVVSERGSGFTWAGSSYFYRLTPWHNDPVSDPATEVLYLRDEETGGLWSATPAPAGQEATHTVRHGPGRSVFESVRDDIETRLVLGMVEGEAVKLSVLRVTNRSSRPRTIGFTAYVEWTLGVHREQTQHQVRTGFIPELGAVFARNLFDPRPSARHFSPTRTTPKRWRN
jgi:cyclic beta-1,2-glucan synthetase